MIQDILLSGVDADHPAGGGVSCGCFQPACSHAGETARQSKGVRHGAWVKTIPKKIYRGWLDDRDCLKGSEPAPYITKAD
jgi:hypothetical protein